MSRPYRIINGICYNQLWNDDPAVQPKQISTDTSNPESFYYDPAIRLNRNDLNMFKGKPLCLEHDVSKEYGVITDVWADRDGHARITARVYTDDPEGEDLFQKINQGEVKGLSVNYSTEFDPQTGRLKKKMGREISACRTEFFKGSQIAVTATAKPDYKLVFTICASTETKIMDSANKDASELARVHDDLLKKLEEKEQREKEIEKKLQLAAENEAKWLKYKEQQDALEAQRVAEYQAKQKPELEKTLSTIKEQWAAEKGETSQLPQEFVDSVTKGFMNPDPQYAAAVAPIVASANAWKKAQQERQEYKARMDDYETKIKKISDDHAAAMAHVEASKRLHLNQTEQTTPVATPKLEVTAYSSQMNASNLFAPPSQEERDLYKQNYGVDAPTSVSVTASSIPPAPTHHLKKHLPFSPGNNSVPGSKVLFDFVCARAHQLHNSPVPIFGLSDEVFERKDL
jgi:hypothetical protein